MSDQATYRSVHIPKNLNRTGVARITAKTGTLRHFGLDKLPYPPDMNHSSGGLQGEGWDLPVRGVNFGAAGYRIAYPLADAKRGYGLARFRVSDDFTRQSLQVLADLLDQGGAAWLFLTDENGARLSRTYYTSRRWLSKSTFHAA